MNNDFINTYLSLLRAGKTVERVAYGPPLSIPPRYATFHIAGEAPQVIDFDFDQETFRQQDRQFRAWYETTKSLNIEG